MKLKRRGVNRVKSKKIKKRRFTMKKGLFLTLGVLALVLPALLIVVPVIANPGSQTQYDIKATKASLQREVTAPATGWVQGVPASPVDSFVYDGVGSVPLTGAVAHLDIDPVNNTGRIIVQWSDENGKWKLVQEAFMPPRSPVGSESRPLSKQHGISLGRPHHHQRLLAWRYYCGGRSIADGF